MNACIHLHQIKRQLNRALISYVGKKALEVMCMAVFDLLVKDRENKSAVLSTCGH